MTNVPSAFGRRARVTVPEWQLSDNTRMRTPVGEAAQLVVQLVVDQLTVVQTPSLVLLVGFVAGDVGHLAAMTREGEEEKVSCTQRLGGITNAGQYVRARALLRQQHARLHALRSGKRSQVVRVEFTRRERSAPAAVGRRAHRVQTNIQRQRPRLGRECLASFACHALLPYFLGLDHRHNRSPRQPLTSMSAS